MHTLNAWIALPAFWTVHVMAFKSPGREASSYLHLQARAIVLMTAQDAKARMCAGQGAGYLGAAAAEQQGGAQQI